jgi:hypothetical protein
MSIILTFPWSFSPQASASVVEATGKPIQCYLLVLPFSVSHPPGAPYPERRYRAREFYRGWGPRHNITLKDNMPPHEGITSNCNKGFNLQVSHFCNFPRMLRTSETSPLTSNCPTSNHWTVFSCSNPSILTAYTINRIYEDHRLQQLAAVTMRLETENLTVDAQDPSRFSLIPSTQSSLA